MDSNIDSSDSNSLPASKRMKTKSTDSVDATRNDLESVVEQDDSTVKEEDAELKNGEEKEDDLAGEAYSYTRSGKFTSELYKIEINNLPRYMNFSDLKKLFRNKVKINPIKLKVIRNGSGKAVFAFATFRNETERDEVIKTMNGMTVKNCELRVHAAKPKKDPYIVSKKLLEINSDPIDYDGMTDAQRHELIYDRICPLWKMPYEQQLQEKQSAYQDLLDQLVVELKELYRDCELDEDKEQNESIADWMKQLEKIELEPIRFDEQNTGYRNKCEFSVGTDRVVGFRLNAYKQGSLKVIAPGADCPILNATSLKLRQLFEQYLAKSDLKPTDGYSQCGQWRALTVRTGSNGCMVIVHINLDDLTAERVETEKRSLKQLFEAQSEVISLYVNSSLVYGEKQIEQCMDCDRLRFQISPVSFFQINVKAAERCYAAIGELLSLNRQVFLLDVCCGTGTIGLFLADRVHKVLGVELNKQAVSDAEANAANNQIMNAEFVAGAAETQISVLIRKAEQIAKQKDTRQLQIVAVLDPPRAGLNKSLIRTLRSCAAVTKLVYVSCEPKLAKQNLIDLCRPISKAYSGNPFKLSRAMPIDMFPHTRQCELLVLYER